MIMYIYIYVYTRTSIFGDVSLLAPSFVENDAAARPLSMAAFVSEVQPQVRMNPRGR